MARKLFHNECIHLWKNGKARWYWRAQVIHSHLIEKNRIYVNTGGVARK